MFLEETTRDEIEGEIQTQEWLANSYMFDDDIQVRVIMNQSFSYLNFRAIVEDINTSVEILYNPSPLCDNTSSDTEVQALLTNIEIDGNIYNDVFVFSVCWDATNETIVERIVYSIENGIEYVSFYDGSFYRRN